MEYRRIIDTHTHTDNSPDGHHSAMFLCETAEQKGLRAIAFTDHCEVDSYYEDNYDRRVRQSFFETAKAKSAFLGKLIVLQGIELAQPHYAPELAERIINAQHYDVVIGSIHNLRGREDFYFMKSFEGLDTHAMIEEYYDENIKMLEWGDFDVLAHITYPFRYLYSVAGISEDIDNYKKKVDTLLSLCAEKDKALEINTGGLRQPLNRTSPELKTIKRYKALGGRLISVGSDAHYAENLGQDIPTAYDMAKEAGFGSVVMFQQRLPLEIPIE